MALQTDPAIKTYRLLHRVDVADAGKKAWTLIFDPEGDHADSSAGRKSKPIGIKAQLDLNAGLLDLQLLLAKTDYQAKGLLCLSFSLSSHFSYLKLFTICTTNLLFLMPKGFPSVAFYFYCFIDITAHNFSTNLFLFRLKVSFPLVYLLF